MKRSSKSVSSLLVPLLVLLGLTAVAARAAAQDSSDDRPKLHKMVAVPEEDRFTPFALQIRVGDTVEWVNNDADDHTVVSDDAINTAGPHHIDVLIPGTGGGGRASEPFKITFRDTGVWIYYCRFHAQIDDENHQPFAPGPDGGIQTEKDPAMCDPAGSDHCNFGTPMMGVITILPRRRHGEEDTISVAPR